MADGRAPSRGRSKRFDPQGKRALFETPPSAARDTIRSGPNREGKEALFSTGPRQAGTVVVACDSCGARTRISVTDVLMRLAQLSLFLPWRGHLMRCPACERRRWCTIDWSG